MSHQIHYEKDIITTQGADLNKGANLTALNSGMGAAAGAGEFSRDFKETTTTRSNASTSLGSGIDSGVALKTGEVIVEKIYEKPVVITHQEKAVFKESYEGQTVEKHNLATDVRIETAAPIVKEIHQDVIHEHHKDVVVEHKKDILHEHHQKVVHEHHQPVIYEKHIHEHHQPIIHEQHKTLIEEKHVPIVHEKHIERTDKETKEAIVHEVFEKAVVEKTEAKPIVTETVEKTVVHSEGSGFNKAEKFDAKLDSKMDKTLLTSATGVNTGAGASAAFVEGGAGLAGGKTYVHEKLEKDGELLEDEEWVIDESGTRRKQKRGFFGHLKDKLTGHHNH